MKSLKVLFTLAIIFSFQLSYARVIEEALPSVMLEDTKLDPTLAETESKYVFRFQNIPMMQEKTRILMYSIDGVEHSAELNAKAKLEVVSTPGNHSFQFYYSGDYYEVYSGPLHIAAQYTSNYTVYFEEANIQILTEKPIIYLYPETDTLVTVKLKASGKLTFTYPEYNDGWEFTASPNGDLTFGDDTYNYLFWESSKRYVMHSTAMASGFYVSGEDATSFLEEKLTEAGLNSKERTDFITYWAPRLAQNENNYVRFEFNESCDRFAKLEITPKPDNLYRIYMLWFPTKTAQSISPQPIPMVKRDGFTVIEWGGQELPSSLNRAETN